MSETTPAGESGILARILPLLSTGDEVEVGPGDDAAVLQLPSDRLVVTTDTLVAGHDFLTHTTCPRWIGHKAAVANLADVAAMAVRPLALVVAVSAPADTPTAMFEELTAGLAARAEADGASIVGGDLGRAPQLTVTVTALGAVEPGREPVLRSGARPGDQLAIGAARLGRSAAGLALVLAGRVRVEPGPEAASVGATPPIRPDGVADGAGPRIHLDDITDPSAASLVAWHDAPDPDLALGWGAGRTASAMMDLSDGLVRDGTRLARAGDVDLVLSRDALSDDAGALAALARELGAEPWNWVLHGGEEHALLATFPAGAVPAGFRIIGRVAAPSDPHAPAVTLDGEPIPGSGWDHFG